MKDIRSIRFSEDNPAEYGLSPQEGKKQDYDRVRIGLLSEAVRIVPQLFPEISEITCDLKACLHSDSEIEYFVYNDATVQASCISMDEGQTQFTVFKCLLRISCVLIKAILLLLKHRGVI